MYEPIPTLPSSCNCPSQLRPGRGTQPGLDFQGVGAQLGTTQRCIVSLDLQVVTDCLRARMWAVNQSIFHTEGHSPDMETVGGPRVPREATADVSGLGTEVAEELVTHLSGCRMLLDSSWPDCLLTECFLAHLLHGLLCQEISSMQKILTA